MNTLPLKTKTNRIRILLFNQHTQSYYDKTKIKENL